LKITSEKDQQSQLLVRIEVENAEREEAKNKAARKVANQVRVPGFRPGKAPRVLVERYVGEEYLLEQALRDLLPKAYENALKDATENNLKPLPVNPNYNIESVDPLVITAVIALEPTVTLGDYKSLKFDMPTTEVTDEDVEEFLENLRQQRATFEDVTEERAATNGDQVELELITLRDGEPTGDPFTRKGELGKGELLSQIDDQIVGMNVGEEKVVEINRQPDAPTQEAATETDEPETQGAEAELPEVETIPLDTEEAEQQKAPMTFQVTLKALKLKKLPELNEEFIKGIANDLNDADELRARIRENLFNQRDNNAKRELTEKIVNAVVEQSTIEMPPALIEAEVHRLEENMEERLKQQKLSLEQYLRFSGKSHEDFHQELHPQAEDTLRKALVLRQVAEAEQIEVTKSDVDREVDAMLGSMINIEDEEQREIQLRSLRGYFAQEANAQQIRDQVYSRKLSERLILLATGVDISEEAKAQTGEAEPETEKKKTRKSAKAKAASDDAETDETEATTPVVEAEAKAASDDELAPVPTEDEVQTPAKPARKRSKKAADADAETDAEAEDAE
jgi:trigger factor